MEPALAKQMASFDNTSSDCTLALCVNPVQEALHGCLTVFASTNSGSPVVNLEWFKCVTRTYITPELCFEKSEIQVWVFPPLQHRKMYKKETEMAIEQISLSTVGQPFDD